MNPASGFIWLFFEIQKNYFTNISAIKIDFEGKHKCRSFCFAKDSTFILDPPQHIDLSPRVMKHVVQANTQIRVVPQEE